MGKGAKAAKCGLLLCCLLLYFEPLLTLLGTKGKGAQIAGKPRAYSLLFSNIWSMSFPANGPRASRGRFRCFFASFSLSLLFHVLGTWDYFTTLLSLLPCFSWLARVLSLSHSLQFFFVGGESCFPGLDLKWRGIKTHTLVFLVFTALSYVGIKLTAAWAKHGEGETEKESYILKKRQPGWIKTPRSALTPFLYVCRVL